MTVRYYFEDKRDVCYVYRVVSYSGCSVIWLSELWTLQIFRFEIECDLHTAVGAQLILTAAAVSSVLEWLVVVVVVGI